MPHFEKMLTDQALLARAYLHAWQATGRADHLLVATETIEYVLDALGAPGGGLFSSEDADAAGVEGGTPPSRPPRSERFWTAAGRLELLDAVLEWYAITEEGDWEGPRYPAARSAHRSLGPRAIQEARALLAAARGRRAQPATDDKVLTEWNAMFAATLAEAAAATGIARWARRAEGVDGVPLPRAATTRGCALAAQLAGGRAAISPSPADMAWVVDACTRLGELTGEARWTSRAMEVADDLLANFWDAPAPSSPLPPARPRVG